MAKKKVKTASLTDPQKKMLRARWAHWRQAVAVAHNAPWYRRKKAEANARFEHAMLQVMLTFAFGEGAVLDMSGPEPTVTLP
ncbi:MAG: hypothetical protein AB7R40_23390 [Nitrospiraceae bacterium]